VRRCGEATGHHLDCGRLVESVRGGGDGETARGGGDGARSDRWQVAFGVTRDLERITPSL
jgi:hypothetical protein